MNGRPGESGLSATIAVRSIKPAAKPLHKSVSRRNRWRPDPRVRRRPPRGSPGAIRSRRPRRRTGARRATGAIVARNRFMPLLLSQPLTAATAPRNELEAAARIGRPADDKAAMLCAFAAGEGIFRRRDQSDRIAQILHIGVAAGLGEQEFWAAPQSREVDVAGELAPAPRSPARARKPRFSAQSASLAAAISGKSYIGSAAIGAPPAHAARPSQSG